jgi:hypothetical protein
MAMRARHLYAMLCVLGLALPNAAFWPWLATHGLAPQRFVTDFLANGVSTFFGLDVILSACVLVLFVETEGRRLGLPGAGFRSRRLASWVSHSGCHCSCISARFISIEPRRRT